MAKLLKNRRGDVEYAYRLSIIGVAALIMAGVIFAVIKGMQSGIQSAANETVRAAEARGLVETVRQVIDWCHPGGSPLDSYGRIHGDVANYIRTCCDNACDRLYGNGSVAASACAGKCKAYLLNPENYKEETKNESS